MRLTATLFAVLLFALTLFAEAGCRRPAPGGTTLAAVSVAHATRTAAAQAQTGAGPQADADSEPAFSFGHPRAEQLGRVKMSAAAAQVAFDAGTTNDDRTEMMALEVEASATAPLPHPIAQAFAAALPMPVPEDLLRPPRAERA
ncbi:MAG: hypothetical protein V4505_21175 [Pseudomonadota bacterium]